MTKQEFFDGVWFRAGADPMVFRFSGSGGVGSVQDITGRTVGKVDLWTGKGCRVKSEMIGQRVQVLLQFDNLNVASEPAKYMAGA